MWTISEGKSGLFWFPLIGTTMKLVWYYILGQSPPVNFISLFSAAQLLGQPDNFPCFSYLNDWRSHSSFLIFNNVSRIYLSDECCLLDFLIMCPLLFVKPIFFIVSMNVSPFHLLAFYDLVILIMFIHVHHWFCNPVCLIFPFFSQPGFTAGDLLLFYVPDRFFRWYHFVSISYICYRFLRDPRFTLISVVSLFHPVLTV